jgi:hypothetical protein
MTLIITGGLGLGIVFNSYECSYKVPRVVELPLQHLSGYHNRFAEDLAGFYDSLLDRRDVPRVHFNTCTYSTVQ